MSEGYHPKLKMSFPSALALGVQGLDEVMELELNEQIESDTLLELLNRFSINGLRFLSVESTPPGAKKAMLFSSVFEMTVPKHSREKSADLADQLMRENTRLVEKLNGKTVDVRQAIRSLAFEKETGKLVIELLTNQGSDAGCREVLTALELETDYFREIFPTRKRVILTDSLPGE